MIDIKDLPKVPEGWMPWRTRRRETMTRMYGKGPEVRVEISQGCVLIQDQRANRMASMPVGKDIPAAIRTCAAFVGGPCNAWLVDTD